MTSSKIYWQQREAEALKHYLTEEKEYQKRINDIYDRMLDDIQKEIDSFYARYADKEGITLAEAKKRVKTADIKEFERKAKRYVKEKNFSKRANEEMRLYNLMMKVNRLEMLKANIGLKLISNFDELNQFMEEILQDRTEEELERQAGILGNTIQNNAELAHMIVNASFHNATYSDRIWMYQDLLRDEIGKQLERGLIQGKNPRVLAREINKVFNTGKYNCERLMRTELARVQIEAQKQSYEKNGLEMYTFITNTGCCDKCDAIAGKHFYVKDMTPGENAPPMHPNCRCSTAPYSDRKEFEDWLNYLEKGGKTENWKKYQVGVQKEHKYIDYDVHGRVEPNKMKYYKNRSNFGQYIVNSSDFGIIKSKKFYTTDDPMREVTGAAEDSNPKEIAEMEKILKVAGVEIVRREKVMAYSPAIVAGEPGQFFIEEGASYSAWCHEFQHFLDDRADGFIGFRVFQDLEKCKQREINAYRVEIELAIKSGRPDIVERLKKLMEKEVAKYE